MAINTTDHPTPTEPRLGLRSYREAASYLVEAERRRGRDESPPPCPTEPRDPTDKAEGAALRDPRHQPPRAPLPRSSSPKSPKAKLSSKAQAQAQSHSKASLPALPPLPSSGSRRSRTPSPPHPAPSSRKSGEPCKASRSVSPGGTPTSSAPKALRKGGRYHPGSRCLPRAVSPEPRLRVSWAEALVASVQTRPRTLRKDVSSLFYSRADERRFRREASFAEEDDEWREATAPPSSPSDDQPSLTLEEPPEPSPALIPTDQNPNQQHSGLWSCSPKERSYAISRAVVVFGDATLTYGSPASAAPSAVLPAVVSPTAEEQGFSFDDDAFWNGRLTWS